MVQANARTTKGKENTDERINEVQLKSSAAFFTFYTSYVNDQVEVWRKDQASEG